MDPITALIAAVFLGGFASGGQQQAQAEFYGCETVDMGGYLNFVDPTCPAGFTANTADYETVTVEVAPGVFEDFEVPTNNK
jgi:hypothetical protein